MGVEDQVRQSIRQSIRQGIGVNAPGMAGVSDEAVGATKRFGGLKGIQGLQKVTESDLDIQKKQQDTEDAQIARQIAEDDRKQQMVESQKAREEFGGLSSSEAEKWILTPGKMGADGVVERTAKSKLELQVAREEQLAKLRALTPEGKAEEEQKKEDVLRKKGMPAEGAGKTAMLEQAKTDLLGIESMLFPGEGENETFNRKLAIKSNMPIIGGALPFSGEAKKVNSRMQNALEAKLRIETGAAATQPEFDRLMDRFGIAFDDTLVSAKDKFERLIDFMDNATIKIDPSGRYRYFEPGKEIEIESPAQAVTSATNNGTITLSDGTQVTISEE